MINNLYPSIKQLNKSDKIRLLQYLVAEIANEEGINSAGAGEEKTQFWLNCSRVSLEQIWDHPDEEIYNELL
ncbi:hypothetical protein VKI21_13835 [Cyanobacterium aponinum UTEX 3222]|uniref:hypothetical protein n=1 Tax=Cyanobacterium aponinum TaxID=379064 RepID=UPI002B4BCA1E|nr:hypothetical protein [Cyanobacterium aponinum]WRL37556.1 hypothetical protein VKI22_13120 [Cyanobacterium aponinum UTEX 3221]WRL41124.1 hypothetical protein VKI21_13835 [Cyanobacterium aponinum UTEX 3222]